MEAWLGPGRLTAAAATAQSRQQPDTAQTSALYAACSRQRAQLCEGEADGMLGPSQLTAAAADGKQQAEDTVQFFSTSHMCSCLQRAAGLSSVRHPLVPGSCPSGQSPLRLTLSCAEGFDQHGQLPSTVCDTILGRALHDRPVYPPPFLTSSTSLTAFSRRGLASSMAAVAVSAASNTLSRPLVSIWRAILVQMYTKSSRATPAQWRCSASAQIMGKV